MDKRPMATGPDVDFALHTIGWKAFQNMSATVVSEAYGQPVATFGFVNDGGRDGGFRCIRNDDGNGLVAGSVTVQCKHSADAGTSLTLGALNDELSKATLLGRRGLAKNYVLVTNMRLSAKQEATIKRQFERIQGVDNVAIHGKEWLTLRIQGSPELRRLVPRVYGLGDLGNILDERAYQQSRKILESIRNDLKTFVVTQSYVDAARALHRYGFVLILGDPGSGKSMIGGTLAVAAADKDKKPTIKIRDADEFIYHWNPLEPNQFFWVDDAFGATQFQRRSAEKWSQVLREMQEAIKTGAYILFTSRTYIYRSAQEVLKSTDLPQLITSQVTIEVERILAEEKAQILYNHVRFGAQQRDFKAAVKGFLKDAASTRYFLPEVARRIGHPFFTKEIQLTRSGVLDFFARPTAYLEETISKLDAQSRGALYLLFMHGGMLQSPLDESALQENALPMLGVTMADVRERLLALDGTLVQHLELGEWRFKHPTVRDAIANIVARQPDLLDVYLRGTPANRAIQEVRCAGHHVQGAAVVLPLSRYKAFLERIIRLEREDIAAFLTQRADKQFLELFLKHVGGEEFGSIVGRACLTPLSSQGSLLVRLHEMRLLNDEHRIRFVRAIAESTVDEPSGQYISDDGLRSLFDTTEIDALRENIKNNVLEKFDSVLDQWRSNYSSSDDPVGHYDDLKEALSEFETLFSDNDSARDAIDVCLREVDQADEDLCKEYGRPDLHDDDDDYRGDYSPTQHEPERDMFDDVDEA